MSGLINHNGFSLAETPSLKGKICVITGGQGGIGQEITANLLKHDISKIYVLARSSKKFDLAESYWRESHGLASKDIEARVDFVACDLSDMRSVKKVADYLMGRLQRLDMLINNAGLPTVADYTLCDGIESIWATNVVGHFELTNILLPKLEDTARKYGDSRIVVTSSSFHIGCQELKLDLTMSPTRIKSPDAMDSCWRYARSKLGTILFTRELARRLEKKGAMNVFANTFFPGNIPTEAMDTWKDLFGSLGGGVMKGAFHVAGQSPSDGAATAIYLATSPKVVERNQKGKYFIPVATEDKTSALAEDKDLARNVW
ncbi:MAG: hypothetical protein M1818_007140 [Claussenomyces sp. TS43310]|nr:MAG: hypothetical protein M1818_007140 [Claussenomyces sp. TS43310]